MKSLWSFGLALADGDLGNPHVWVEIVPRLQPLNVIRRFALLLLIQLLLLNAILPRDRDAEVKYLFDWRWHELVGALGGQVFVWHVVEPPDELILLFFNVSPVGRLGKAVDGLEEEKDYLRQDYFPLDIKVNFHIFELK